MKKQNSTKKALICSVLALVLCCSMLVGTTFAWFTDSVTSKGNIIQTGSLDVEMFWTNADVDVPAKGDDAWIDASAGAMFNNTLWEPGYVEAKHIMVANEGTLAFNYKLRIVANGVVSKLADVIDVYYVKDATEAVDRDNLGTWMGTLTQVLGSGVSSLNALYRHVNGSLQAGETATWTLVLKMRESAGNEYQNLSIGTSFSVELLATQMASEKDSFDENYDLNAPDEELPYALVTPLEGEELNIGYVTEIGGEATKGTLNTGYKFEPTIFNQHPDGNNVVDDVDSSIYKQWHADFYVYADRDVPAGAIGLAGYYNLFCSDEDGCFNVTDGNWVALTNDGMDIKANEGVRLLDGVGKLMGGNICVTYKNICQYGNDGLGFMCGAYAIDATALAGTTLTVELRLYETTVDWTESSHGGCQETGKSEIVGTFNYTFPAVEVADQAGLEAALSGGAADIEVAEGTYTFPASKLTAGTTLYCEEGTVFSSGAGLNIDGATVVGATFNNVASHNTVNGTYKDCTFTGSNGLRYGFAGETVVFENCVFDGSVYGVHFDSGANEVIFKNCTFSGFNAFGAELTKLTLKGCTFVGNGKSGYNGINMWGNTDLIDCTFVFDGTSTYEWLDLCSENKTASFTNCVVKTGEDTTGNLADYVSKRHDSGKIIIDGVEK